MEPSYMMWVDDTKKKPTEEKIAEGLQYYREKYGKKPTICMCNAIDEIPSPFHGARIVTKTYVRPNKFLIGVVEIEAPVETS